MSRTTQTRRNRSRGVSARLRAGLRLEQLETRALLSASLVAPVAHADLVEQVGLRSEQLTGSVQAAATLDAHVGPVAPVQTPAAPKNDVVVAAPAAVQAQLHATVTFVGPLSLSTVGNLLARTEAALQASSHGPETATQTNIVVAGFFGWGATPIVAVVTITETTASASKTHAAVPVKAEVAVNQADQTSTNSNATEVVVKVNPTVEVVSSPSAHSARVFAPLGISTSDSSVDATTVVTAFDSSSAPATFIRIVTVSSGNDNFPSTRIILFFVSGFDTAIAPVQVTTVATVPPIFLDARPPVLPGVKEDPFELLRRSGGGSDYTIQPEAAQAVRPDVPSLPPPPPAPVVPPDMPVGAALTPAALEALFGQEAVAAAETLTSEAVVATESEGANPVVQASFALLGVAFGVPRKDEEEKRRQRLQTRRG